MENIKEKVDKEIAENKKLQADYYTEIFGTEVRPEGYALAKQLQDDMFTDIVRAIDDLGVTSAGTDGEKERQIRMRNCIITFFLFALKMFEGGIKTAYNVDKPLPQWSPIKEIHPNFKQVLDTLKKEMTDEAYVYCEKILTVHYATFCECLKVFMKKQDALSNMMICAYRLYMLEITEHLKANYPRTCENKEIKSADK